MTSSEAKLYESDYDFEIYLLMRKFDENANNFIYDTVNQRKSPSNTFKNFIDLFLPWKCKFILALIIIFFKFII